MRYVLGLIRNSGEERVVVASLKNPLSRKELVTLIAYRVAPRAICRGKGESYDE